RKPLMNPLSGCDVRSPAPLTACRLDPISQQNKAAPERNFMTFLAKVFSATVIQMLPLRRLAPPRGHEIKIVSCKGNRRRTRYTKQRWLSLQPLVFLIE